MRLIGANRRLSATPPVAPGGWRGRIGRALLLAAFVLCQTPSHLGCLGEPAFADGGPPVVYVYLHTDAKFAELERVLQSKLPGLQVTVFGRFRDFEEALVQRPPDAVVGVGALLASLSLPPALQGWRAGSDGETYALLSIDTALDGALPGKVIGSVDLLGRTATQSFVAALLGEADIRVKREYFGVCGIDLPLEGKNGVGERNPGFLQGQRGPRISLSGKAALASSLRCSRDHFCSSRRRTTGIPAVG